MEISSFLDLGWVLLFAVIAGLVCVRLRVPPVAGLLVAGMLIGPNLLGLVDLPTINVFAEIGAMLLLFMIGVEFSIAKLMKTGLRAIIGGLILVIIMFVVMHETAVLLGLDSLTALCVAAVFSFSSTAIMMKILEQKNLIERLEVPTLVAILIIEDIIAVFLITFFSELKTGSYTADDMIGALIISLVILGFTYVILLKILKKFSEILLRHKSEDTLVMFAIGLGLGMSILASMLGISPAIGAFLAGSMIAALPNGRDFEHSLKPFDRLFSSFFFISIGMFIDPFALIASVDITLILVGTFMASVFLTVTFTFYLISSNGRSSLFAGLAMLPLGEFSLLIAKETVGIASIDLVGVASVGVLISSVIGSLIVEKHEKAYLIIKRKSPPKALKTLKKAADYFIGVISAFEPGGDFHRLLITEVKKLAKDIIYLISAALLFLIAKGQLQFEFVFLGNVILAEHVLLVVLVLVTLIPFVKLAFSIKRIFDALSEIFSRTTKKKSKAALLRNVVISVLFFILFANLNILVEFLMLPRIFNWLSIIFGILSVFFFWSALRVAASGVKISEEKIIDLFSIKIISEKDDEEDEDDEEDDEYPPENVHPLLR